MTSPIPAITISAFSAITGDLASSIVKVPREIITCRLQTGHYSKSTFSFALKSILKEEGIGGLFRGFWSTTARDWPFMMILFGSYETFKFYHSPPVEVSVHISKPIVDTNAIHHEQVLQEAKVMSTFSHTLYGGISGALAGYITTPFDVIKTRIMTSENKGMVTVIRDIIRESKGNGLSIKPLNTLFRGCLPRSTWWFVVCSVFFPVYASLNELLEDPNVFINGERSVVKSVV